VPPADAVPLSVVMPVYNEAGAIALAVDEVRGHVLDHVPGAELVVVDDGSRDGTATLLDGIAQGEPRVRVVHQQNRGHGGALLTGLAHARGDFVFLIDSDRQIPLHDFGAAWAHVRQGREAVFGVRRRRHDPAIRVFLSRLIGVVVRALFGVRLRDANVPYKLFRRSMWQDASACIPAGTLAPSLFLAIFAKARGRDVFELDVVHKERETGEVSIRRLKLLKFCAAGLRQMWAFRRCLRG
jgi:glycosyltransferase involved in cell wall biosynthesis